MTAIDVTMAKALVTLLNDQTFSNDATAFYARDVELNLEEVSAATIYVDGTVAHERKARDYWTRSVSLSVVVVGAQSATGDSGATAVEDEKDAWLAFIDDELIDAIQSGKVSGKKAQSIDFDQRLDAGKAREMSLFYTKFQISFALV